MKPVVPWIFALLIGSTLAAPTLAGNGPVAPQLPGQLDTYGQGYSTAQTYTNQTTGGTNDRFADVDPGGSLFVDPTGGNFPSAGPCRYVTNAATTPGAVEIPLATPLEWQEFIAGTSSGTPPPGIAAVVCCRPAAPTDPFCSGGTVQSVSNVSGGGINGYGQLGPAGVATASCSDAYGTYTETHSYQCVSGGSGVTADGVWQFQVDQGDSCTSANTTTYGACSTAGVGGWGNQWAVTKDCVGNIVSQGYFGPACYTTPPCSTNWQPSYGSCSGACGGGSGTQTVTWTDYGTCNGGSYSYPQGCVNNNACAPQLVGGGSCVPFPVGGTDCVGTYGPCYGGPGCGYGCGDTPPQGPGGCYGPSSWSAWGDITGTTTYPTGCAAGSNIVYTQTNADWNLPNDIDPGAITAFQCWSNP